jgi:hypothetical protein
LRAVISQYARSRGNVGGAAAYRIIRVPFATEGLALADLTEAAHRTSQDLVLDGNEAVFTVHDMGSRLECVSFVRLAAVQTAIRATTESLRASNNAAIILANATNVTGYATSSQLGCRPSPTASLNASLVVRRATEREGGIRGESYHHRVDLAKNVFQLHGGGGRDGAFRKKLTRLQFHRFMAEQPVCLVAMEACGGAHYWAREMRRLGHDVRPSAPACGAPTPSGNEGQRSFS